MTAPEEMEERKERKWEIRFDVEERIELLEKKLEKIRRHTNSSLLSKPPMDEATLERLMDRNYLSDFDSLSLLSPHTLSTPNTDNDNDELYLLEDVRDTLEYRVEEYMGKCERFVFFLCGRARWYRFLASWSHFIQRFSSCGTPC